MNPSAKIPVTILGWSVVTLNFIVLSGIVAFDLERIWLSCHFAEASVALKIYVWFGVPISLLLTTLLFLQAAIAEGSVACKFGLWVSLVLLAIWITWVIDELAYGQAGL